MNGKSPCARTRLADTMALHLKLDDASPGFNFTDEDMALMVDSLRTAARENEELAALRSRLEAVGAEVERWRKSARLHLDAAAKMESSADDEWYLHRESARIYTACALDIYGALNGKPSEPPAATIDDVPSCGMENDYRKARP
ncbi:hypothetical protein [Bradyrhizobium cenepequi]|uniref:hypothetical protein n=1 Tax=Bradyrhizobium cenepequi TaxID=2821403 RepID=UPI001CE25633|nr:hypothetical protein [Bradyrhizobium cenepequi]MCA6108172.1 hypothetical protein [Bradyrhizobium cenepequi]